MPGWEQLGMQAASQGISGALGLVLGNINDRRQLRQQEKLQNLQIKGDKQLTNYNFLKQMEMWRNTNYPAQMAMMKAAGLNPALMYEGGGQGASTAITQGTVTGGNAPTGGGEIMQMMAMGLTRDLQLAQIENIKAQTAKTQAETGAVAPAIQKTQAETGNIKIDTELKNLEKAFQESTFKNRESLINLSLSKLIEEVKIIENERDISDDTKTQRIKEVYNRVANLAQDTLQKEASTAKSKKELEEINAKIELLKQTWDINSIDQQLAKEGINPNVKLMKLGGSLWDLLKQIF